MFHQILPPEGRSEKELPLNTDSGDLDIFTGNDGIMVIDDGGKPPSVARDLKKNNPNAWAVAMGLRGKAMATFVPRVMRSVCSAAMARGR